MLALALTLCLAGGVSDAELTPPPLVSADPARDDSPKRTPLPVKVSGFGARHDEAENANGLAARHDKWAVDDGEPQRNEVHASGERIGLTWAAAGGTAAMLLGGGIYLATSISASDSGTATLIEVMSVPVSFFGGVAIGYLVHHLDGGQGSFPSSIGGAAIGGGLAIAGGLLMLTQLHSDPGVAGDLGLLIGAGALFGLLNSLVLERSSYNTMQEQRPHLSVAPRRGGAVAMAGVDF